MSLLLGFDEKKRSKKKHKKKNAACMIVVRVPALFCSLLRHYLQNVSWRRKGRRRRVALSDSKQ